MLLIMLINVDYVYVLCFEVVIFVDIDDDVDQGMPLRQMTL